MTTTLKAHFDGTVFVPDEPVAVAAGTKVEVHVPVEPDATKLRRASLRKELLLLCSKMNGGVGRRTWTREDLYDRRTR